MRRSNPFNVSRRFMSNSSVKKRLAVINEGQATPDSKKINSPRKSPHTSFAESRLDSVKELGSNTKEQSSPRNTTIEKLFGSNVKSPRKSTRVCFNESVIVHYGYGESRAVLAKDASNA